MQSIYAVWDEVEAVWVFLTPSKPFIQTRTMNELIALMTVSPALKKFERRRWTILYRTAVWCLWKAYLSHSFNEPHKYWLPTVARDSYR